MAHSLILLWQRLDKVKNISFLACCFNLLLSDFRCWLSCTKQNVEADGTGVKSLKFGNQWRITHDRVVTHRFLRHECDLLSILLDVVFVDWLVIKENLANKGVIETFDQLNAANPSTLDRVQRA